MSRLNDVLNQAEVEAKADPEPNIESLETPIHTYFQWLGRALERRERVTIAEEDERRLGDD